MKKRSKAMAVLKKRTFKTYDGVVCYWVTAQPLPDAPWLVFLPGLTADHTLFDWQVKHFSGTCNILTWDAPAHGESRPYPLTFTLDDLANILRGILEREHIEHPILVGQSLGGYITQVYLKRYQGHVRGFVSIDSAPIRREYLTGAEIWLLKHAQGMYAIIPWKLLLKWGSDGAAATAHARANMRAMMENYAPREYVKLTGHGYRILAEAYESARPYAIDCPAILLCGEKDNAGSVKRFNKEWAKRTGMPLVWIPNAGHNSNVDQPEAVNAQIETFIAHLR